MNLSYPFVTGATIMLVAFVASLVYLQRKVSPQADTGLAD